MMRRAWTLALLFLVLCASTSNAQLVIDGYRDPAARLIGEAVGKMKRDGLENVHTERVMVPKWVRGAESADIVSPAPHSLVMLGLGDSVGTPPDGVQAEVLVVHAFEELEAHAAQARGRIVLFNVPFTAYGETVRFRSAGASRAAR